MKKVLFILFMFVIVVTGFIFLDSNKVHEQASQLPHYYETFERGNIQLHVADESTFRTEEVLNDLMKTRDLAEQLFQMDFHEHKDLSIFVTLPGYEGHERLVDLAGAYYPKRSIVLINGEDEQFSRATMVHEYSHFLFDQYLDRSGLTIEEIPAWFGEGLAEYFTLIGEGSLSHYYSYYFGALPFEQLHENDKKMLNTVYLQGFYAVYHLIEMYGDEVIMDLMQAFKKTKDFSLAFKEVTELDYITYHEIFRIDFDLLNDFVGKSADPAVILAEAAQLFEGKAMINSYTPFVLPYTIDAAIQLNQLDLAKAHFQQLEKLLYNPSEYLIYMRNFVNVGEIEFAKRLVEKARDFGDRYCYDLSSFEKEIEKLGL